MTNKVPVVPPLSKKKIESLAEKILQHFDPDGFSGARPVDIESFFEFDLKNIKGLGGLKTGYQDLSALGLSVYGYTDASLKTSLVHSNLSDDNTPAGYRMFRSTVAHESAHCVLHIPVLFFKSILLTGAGVYRAERHDIPAYLDPEWQAWTLGGALLMPRHLIGEYYRNGSSIYELAEIFDVNPAFVRGRLKTLEILKK